MVCQRGCRVNLESIAADNLVGSEILAASFDKEETAIILKDLPEDELPLFLRRKLDLLDLAGYSRVLGRNLRALMQGATSPSQGAMSEE
jgi:hypothetical protein